MSHGHNLSSDTSCGLTEERADLAGGRSATSGRWRRNGGPTRTHALQALSAAIDAGNPAQPGSGQYACPTTDQRGNLGRAMVMPRMGRAATSARTSSRTRILLIAAVSIADSPDPARVGQPLTYTITVTNNGPALAYLVTLTDTLPAGVTFGSATANLGDVQRDQPTRDCRPGNRRPGNPPRRHSW